MTDARSSPDIVDAIVADVIECWDNLKRDEGAFPAGDRRAAMSEHRLWHAIQGAKAWLKCRAAADPAIAASGESGPAKYWREMYYDLLKRVDAGEFSGVAQAEPNRVALIGVNRLLNKISNLIDDEDTCDPLDDAIKWANEALAIMGTLALPSTTFCTPEGPGYCIANDGPLQRCPTCPMSSTQSGGATK